MYDTLENAQANKIPWTGWYWPLPPSDTLPNLYDPNGPLEKYDEYVEKTRGYNPGSQQWELDHRSSGQAWSGHCHAWAAASILEPDPTSEKVDGISFTQDQVEGLLTALYDAPAYKVWGVQCDSCNHNSSQFMDVNPADFDMVMRQYIGQQHTSVIIDADPDTPIWNYPAYKYSRASTVNGDSETVTMILTIAKPAINIGGTQSDTMRYTYTLQAGTPGQWTGSSVSDHPDYIWVPTGRIRGGGVVNPGLSYNIVEEIIHGGKSSSAAMDADKPSREQ